MKTTLILLLSLTAFAANGQNAEARAGNALYREGKFEDAATAYSSSVAANRAEVVPLYNLGNAYFRAKKFAEAAATYEQVFTQTDDRELLQRAYYNQGVSYSRQNKLEESIDSYKKAVKLNPADEDARINLQKALLELRKKQPPSQQQNKDNKQQQNKQQQPRSKLSKKEVERLLKALEQREQQVQQKMQENRNRSAGKQEKDW